MSEQPHYVVSPETRSRCLIIEIGDGSVVKERFSVLSLELFHYLLETDTIDFNLYFRVDNELVRFVTPPEFCSELITKMIVARQKEADRIEIFIESNDLSKFIHLIESVRTKKVSSLLERHPELDAKTLRQFSDLSNVSQMIVKGGISKKVAKKAQNLASHIIHELTSSEIAIGTLSQMILADPSLYDHSASVAMISGIISKKMLGKQTQVSEMVTLAGLYHDVGKTCVPHHILHKPARLTTDEFEIIKTHTTLGYEELCQAIDNGAPISHDIALAALEHHEKFCGGGYPHGKSGRLEEQKEGIHPYARIVTIADVFSALLMKRVYKEAYDQKTALSIMEQAAARDYDPLIFTPFKQHIGRALGRDKATIDKREDKGRIIIIDKDTRSKSAS